MNLGGMNLRLTILCFLVSLQACAWAQEAAPGRVYIVREVRFSGAQKLPNDELQRLAESVENQRFSGPKWTDELANRARTVWQENGYFRATVGADVKELPGSSSAAADCSVTFRVTEGAQYRLQEIRFGSSPPTVFSQDELRQHIQLADGEVLNATKLLAGLDAISSTYRERGYLKFAMPLGFEYDEQHHLVLVDLNVSEGKQYRLGSAVFTGGDAGLAGTLRSRFPLQPGDIYDAVQVDAFFRDNDLLLPAGPRDSYMREIVDDKKSTISLEFNLAQPGKK